MTPQSLYADRKLLAPEHNLGFLKRCIDGIREVNFALQASGRIYLRLACGTPVLIDREALQIAAADPCTHAALRAVVASAFDGAAPAPDRPQFLDGSKATPPVFTLGQWGTATR